MRTIWPPPRQAADVPGVQETMDLGRKLALDQQALQVSARLGEVERRESALVEQAQELGKKAQAQNEMSLNLDRRSHELDLRSAAIDQREEALRQSSTPVK